MHTVIMFVVAKLINVHTQNTTVPTYCVNYIAIYGSVTIEMWQVQFI